MRDYGKVYGTFWTSDTTGALSDNGKLLALYLMTTTHATIAGVFRMPDGYVSEDLNWPIERVQQGFSELLSKGFATRCEDTKWVWVTKHLEWNPPENPNQIKGARKIALAVPDACCWKQAFMRASAEVLAIELPPISNHYETLQEGSPNQEQKAEGRRQEQDQKAGTGDGAAPSAPPAAASAAGTRGARLKPEWLLPKAWGEWALAKYPHWTADTVRAIASKFRNHWVAKSGKDATKVDWQATWENWCDSGITQGEHPPPKRQSGGDLSDSAEKAARVGRMLGHGAGAEAVNG